MTTMTTTRPRRGRATAAIVATALSAAGLFALTSTSAGATTVSDEASFVAAWENNAETQIDLSADVTITCATGVPLRNSTTPVTVDGHGFTIEQTCAGFGVLDQDNTGLVTLANVTLTGGDDTNGGSSGGGALHTFGDVMLINATLTGNHTNNEGGAIETDDEGAVTVIRSTISNNSADGSGGGIAAQGFITVTQSTLSGNTSGNSGGAMRNYDSSQIVNSTIQGNSVEGTGGAIDSSGDVTLGYATIVDNDGDSITADTLTSSASVIGQASSGDACFVGDTTSNGYNVDDDGTCGFGSGPGDLSDYSGSFGLGPFEPHQSVRDTMYPEAGSPLLDAVPVAACGMGMDITVDEDGVTRPQGPGCEIGASEVFLGVPDVPTTPITPAAPIAAQPAFTG